MFDIFSKENETWCYLGGAKRDEEGNILLFLSDMPEKERLIIVEKEELFNLSSKKINLDYKD